MSSIDQPDEMDIAREMLTWEAFSAGGTAKVLCIPSSDPESRLCSQAFEIVDFPSLIISNSPRMESHVRIGPTLLFNIAAQ
jgi:hypothetical protein